MAGWVSNPGPLAYESGALLTALHGPACSFCDVDSSGIFVEILKNVHLRCILSYFDKYIYNHISTCNSKEEKK